MALILPNPKRARDVSVKPYVFDNRTSLFNINDIDNRERVP